MKTKIFNTKIQYDNYFSRPQSKKFIPPFPSYQQIITPDIT